ncbi:ABC-F family ATP-binding cassette domain-containing protein [soil metagenome]
MNYLSAENISKTYGDRWLFKNLNMGINRGQRFGLVGVNGSGKSTLLQVLTGKLPPDSGLVSVRKGISVSFLGQNPELDGSATVHQTLFSGQSEVLQAIKAYELCMEDPNANPDKVQKVMEQMDALNAWEYEVNVKQILSRLGITNLESKIGHLSGGQRKRVALARVLIDEPDLLIMDEPTHHLDLDTIEWFENILSGKQQTLLMVTHDRYFLDNVANEILELEQGQIYAYKGNYAYFVEKKAEREQQQDVEVGKARNLLKKELEWMRRQPQARGTKSRSRIDAFYDLKEKAAGKVTGPGLELSVKSTRQGGKILELDDISKKYGDKWAVRDFTYVFKKGDRLGIVGPNGTGKTTLLNMLTGKLAPDSGEIEVGETTVFGYYTQSEMTFRDDQRVIDVVKEIAEVVETAKGETITAAQFLQHFQFSPAMQYTMVSKLSGGEKRRLQLLRVLIKNPNFLILDEPTNDLDIITLNILEDFLTDFGGCLLIVSHDRYFMDQLVEHLFVFEGSGQIRHFPGNYTDYREWLKERERETEKEAMAAKPSPPPPAAAPAAPEPKEAGSRKASFAEKREYEQLEKEIERLENQKQKLIADLNGGTPDHTQLREWAEELKKTDLALDQKSERWLELAELF